MLHVWIKRTRGSSEFLPVSVQEGDASEYVALKMAMVWTGASLTAGPPHARAAEDVL